MTRARANLLAALCLAAVTPVAAGDEAIPYDAKKAKAVADRDRAWLEAATRTAYRTAGRRSPKWDADVDAAFRANLDRVYGPIWGRASAEARLRTALQMAIDAGCDDPLVRHFRGPVGARPADGGEGDGTGGGRLATARAVGAGEYPAVWKARAYLEALNTLPADTEAKERDACQHELLRALVLVAKDPAPPARRALAELCFAVHQAGAGVHKRQEWFDRLEKEVLSGLAKMDPTSDVCAGQFLVRFAWDARGVAPAARVAPEAMRLFEDRLAEAGRRLTAAWDRDHECAAAAVEMVTVCMGLGRDRDEMETWFRRAVAADPTRTEVFDRKLNYLQPKWLGSADDLRKFGREIIGLGRWETVLPLVALEALRDAAPAAQAERDAYFRSAELWADVGPVLEEVRKRYPDSAYGASAYLYFAWQAERNPAEAVRYARAPRQPLPIGLFPSKLHITTALDWATDKAKAE